MTGDTVTALSVENLLKMPKSALLKLNSRYFLTKEQFEALFKNDKLQYIKDFNLLKKLFAEYGNSFKNFTDDEIIKNLNSISSCFDLLNKNELERLNINIVNKIENVNNIVESDNFYLLDKNIKKILLKKVDLSKFGGHKLESLLAENLPDKIFATITEENIKTLNDEAIEIIINKDISVKEGKLKSAVLDIFESDKKDMENIINSYIDNEDFETLKTNCIRWSLKNKHDVINILENLKFRNNFYGKIHKAEILSNLVLLKEDSGKEYKQFIITIKDIAETKPDNIDGYFTKINFLLKNVKSDNFNSKFSEALAEEAILSAEACIRNCYNIVEKNSIHNDLRNLYVDTLLTYADIIVKNYNLDENKISKKRVEDLNAEEMKYLNIINKAYEFKPDAITKVKSFLTPILSIGAKAAGTYFITKKVSEATKSSALSVGIGATGAAIVGKQIYDEAQKIAFFSNKKSFHERQLDKEFGFFANIWNKTKQKANNVLRGIKKFFGRKSKFGTENYNCNNDEFFANSYKGEVIKSLKNLDERINNDVISKFEDVNEKHVRLVNASYNLKLKAIEIWYSRKLERIYEKYPDLKDNGIDLKDALKGLYSSVVDVASLGIGFTKTKNDLKTAIKYKKYKSELDRLNAICIEKIKNTNTEKARKLASLNSVDKTNFDKMLKENNDCVKALNTKVSNQFVDNIYSIHGKLPQFYNVKNIEKRIDKNTGFLKSLNKFNKKSVDNCYNEIVTLILNDKISNETKALNVLEFISKISELSDSGYYNKNKCQEKIEPLLAAISNFENGSFIDKFMQENNVAKKHVEEYKRNCLQVKSCCINDTVSDC